MFGLQVLMITKLWSHLKIIFSVFCKGDIIKWRNEEEKIGNRNITGIVALEIPPTENDCSLW